jgi:hypothetical protein
MRRPASLMYRGSTSFATLVVALTLAPSLFRTSGEVAEAKEKATCRDKFQSCSNRCWSAAEKGFPGDLAKQNDALDRCQTRTCTPPRKNCYAAAKEKEKGQKDREGHRYQLAPIRSKAPADAAEGHELGRYCSNTAADIAEGYEVAHHSSTAPDSIALFAAWKAVAAWRSG